MARFEVTGPDGGRFEITAPDDASDADVMAYVQSQFAPKEAAPKPAPVVAAPAPVGDTSDTSLIRDIPGSLIAGVGGIASGLGGVQGMITGNQENTLSDVGKKVTEFGHEMMSPGLRAKQAQVQALIKDAEQRGLGPEVMATLKGYLSDPYLLANFAIEQAPSLIPGLGAGKGAQIATKVGARVAGRAVPAAETLAKVGTGAAIGTGAGMQGGQVAQQTYEDIIGIAQNDPKLMSESPAFNELVQQGMTPEEATKKLAADGARIAGVVGAGISAVTAGLGGAEKAAFTAGGVKGGLARRVLTGAAKEGAQEFAEEGGGQLAQNIAASEFDPNRPLLQGVGSQGTLGALGGVGPGAVVSGLHGQRAAPAPEVPESVGRPVEPPKGLPDLDTPIGFQTEDGVRPARVMAYVEQDGETFARVVPETAPEAQPEPAFLVPVADLQTGLRPAPEVGGAPRTDAGVLSQAEAEDITAQADEARQTAREKRRGPELAVDVRQVGPRLESVPDADLERRAESMRQVVERLRDDPSVAISNLMDMYGMAPDEAHAAVQQDITRFQTRIAAMRAELDRRGTVTQAAPEVDPLTGVAPLLRARPEASEAETGSLTRPRAPVERPQGTLRPVAGSEAETAVSLTSPALRKTADEKRLVARQGEGVPFSTELERDAVEREKAEAELARKGGASETRYFDYDKPKSFKRVLDSVLGKGSYTLAKSGSQWRATAKDGRPLTVGQREIIEDALNAARERRGTQADAMRKRGLAGRPMSLLESIAQRGIRAGSPAASAFGEKVLRQWTPDRKTPGARRTLIVGEGDPRWAKAATEVDQLVGYLDGVDPLYIGEEWRGNGSAAERVQELIENELAGVKQMPLDVMDDPDAEIARLRDKFGDQTDADAVANEEVEDTRDAADADIAVEANEAGIEYEAPPIADDEWAAILQEAEDARNRNAEGSAREGAAEFAEDEGGGVERERQPGEEDEGAGVGEEAGAAGETVAPGATFEPAPKSVKGGGEQGVLVGTERSAKQAQAARDAKGGLRADVEQKPAGGLFDEGEKPGDLFEFGSPRHQAASRESVKDALRDILGPDAKVDIVDMITDVDGTPVVDATGRYDPLTNMIYIAAKSPDMIGTARHEAVHALRDLGVITDPQWKTLTDEAAKWRKQYQTDVHYNEDNVRDGDGNPVSAEVLEEVRQEEAVAAAYAEWLRGDRTFTGRVKAAFERIRAFFDALRTRLFEHPETARGIFYAMDAGKMAPFATKALAERFAQAATDVNMAAGTVASDAAHTAGTKATGNESDSVQKYNRLPDDKKTGPRWLSMPTRMMSFPLARAATDPLFAAYTTPMLQSQKRASAITRNVQDGMEPIFRLPEKEQTSIKQALELISLNNSFPPVVNGRITIRNETSKVARLTAPNRIVRLSPEATKAMQSYKTAMDNAWDAYAQSAVKAVTGYEGPMSVKEARAAAEAARARNDRQATNEAETAADILAAAEDHKRLGYYPGMRSGDTQIVVRRKLTPEFARMIGQAKARGYPKGENLTGERIDEFLNAATKPADVKFWSELKSDFDSERAKATPQGPLHDDMVWNEHFFLKPPVAGMAVPTTQRMRNRRIAEKTAEVKALMEKRGVDMNEHEIVVRPVKEGLSDQINDQSIPVLEKLLQLTLGGNQAEFVKVWEGMNENIRKNMVSSFRRRSNVVPGFSMDIGDTLSRYSHAVGAVASKLEYRKQIDEALDAIQNNPDPNYDPAMKGKDGYAARLKDYVNNPANDYNALKSFGFMYYMAGVPSTAVQNVTQIPMVALPQLTGIVGPRGAGIMANAWQQSMRAIRIGRDGVRMNVNNLGRTEQERAFLKRMDDEGQITASVTRDLMGRDYDVGPELKAAQGFWKKTYSIAASMFDTAESLNRATALLAGYRAASSPDGQAKIKRAYGKNENFKALLDRKGNIDPEDFAEFFSREVNFEGSRVNRPEALRGLGGVVLQFKSYPMNYVSLLRKNATQMGPEGKMATALMVGMMLAAGGLAGLPFAEDFADGYDNIIKAITGDDPQTIASLQEAMSDWGLGKLGAEAMLRGGSRAATGLDLSRSLGMGNIAPRMSDPLQILGPTPAALLAGPYYGYQRLQSGQGVAAAAQEIAPRALKGPIQAAAVLPEQGLVSRRGRTIIPPSEISTGDRAARALGFQPASFSREYEARGRRMEMMQAAQAKAGSMRSEYARLLALSDDAQRAGRTAAAEDARKKAMGVAEDMARQGIKPPAGADLRKLIQGQLSPESADIKKAPKRLREEMSRNPFPERRE